MKKQDKQTALNQIKQLCDFMLDEAGDIKFSQTRKECLNMIVCLEALKETAEDFLNLEVEGKE